MANCWICCQSLCRVILSWYYQQLVDIIRLADLAMLLMRSGTLSSKTGVKLLLFVFHLPPPRSWKHHLWTSWSLIYQEIAVGIILMRVYLFFPSGFQYNLSLEDILWNPHAVRAELESRFSFDDLHVKKLLSYTAQFTKVNNLNKCFSFLCFYFLVGIPEGIFFMPYRNYNSIFERKAKAWLILPEGKGLGWMLPAKLSTWIQFF